MYQVIIGGDTLIAAPSDSIKNYLYTKSSLDSARAVICQKDTLIASLEQAQKSYLSLVQDQREYIAEADSIHRDYKLLVKNLKKSKGPWLSLNLAAGASTEVVEFIRAL